MCNYPANYELVSVDFASTSITATIRTLIGAQSDLTSIASVNADYLNSLAMNSVASSTPDLVTEFILLEDAMALETALRDYSAEAYASMALINADLGITLRNAVIGTGAGHKKSVANGHFETWVTGFTSSSTLDGLALGPSGTENSVQGGLIGVGFQATDEASFGVFAGVSTFDQEFDQLTILQEGDGFVYGGYAAFQNDGLSADFMIARSTADISGSKSLTQFNETAIYDTKLNAFIGAADFSYSVTPTFADVLLTPSVGVTYLASDRDAFSETGAGLFNLGVDEQSTSFLFTDAALSVMSASPMFGIFSPSVSAGYLYEILGNENETFAYALGETEKALTPGLDIVRGRAIFGAGLNAKLANNIWARFSYDGELGSGYSKHAGSARIGASF